MHIDIDNKLHKQIKDYCGANNLKINDFVNELLKRGFNIERYGLSPFEQAPQINIPSKEEAEKGVIKEGTNVKKRKPTYISPTIKQQDISCKKVEDDSENIKFKGIERIENVEEMNVFRKDFFEKVHEQVNDFIDNPENKQVIKKSKKRKLN